MERNPEGMMSDEEGDEVPRDQGALPDRGAKRPAPGSQRSAPGCVSPAVSVGSVLKSPPPQLPPHLRQGGSGVVTPDAQKQQHVAVLRQQLDQTLPSGTIEPKVEAVKQGLLLGVDLGDWS